MSWSQGFPNSFSPTQQTQEVLKNTDNETKRLYQIISEFMAANGHAHTGDGSDGAKIGTDGLADDAMLPSLTNYTETIKALDFIAKWPIVDIRSFDIDVTEPTSNINAGIAALPNSGAVLFVPPGLTIPISANIIWKSNLHLYISSGASIKLKDNATSGIRIIDARGNLENIGFYGPGWIDGNVDNQTAGNKSHGISICAKGVIIKDLGVKNIQVNAGSMGDAIILEADRDGLTGFQTENVMIINPNIKNIGRQGLTLESGINVNVIGGTFEDITDNAVDMENAGYTIGDIDGVKVQGIYVKNCGGGVSIVTAQPANKLQNIICSDNTMDTVAAAYQLRGCKNVFLCGGRHVNVSNIGVSLYSDYDTTVTDVDIRDLNISGTAPYMVRAQTVGTGSFTNITVDGVEVSGSTAQAFALDKVTGLKVSNNKGTYGSGSGFVINNSTNVDFYDNKAKNTGVAGSTYAFVAATNTNLTVGRNNAEGSHNVGLRLQNNSKVIMQGGDNLDASVTPFQDAGGNTNLYGRFKGSFTMGAAAQINVSSHFVQSNSIITLVPTNASAATLQAGSNFLYVSVVDNVVNTQFRVKTAGGGAAAGTETFSYIIENFDY